LPDIILHHFQASPFAEKVRLALGLKGLDWSSVDIPMVMPKPDLTALTGGYRKTPVMQIGADVYCDTRRIAEELESRFPAPSLFPAGSRGLALALGQWSDAAFFQPGAGLSMGTNTELPEDVLRDRREFFNFLDFDSLESQLPHLYAQFRAHLDLVESMLADSGPFILGQQPGWVDILAYFPLWMARGNIPDTGALVKKLDSLQSWEQRMQAIGHGRSSSISAEDALAVARHSAVETVPAVADDAWPQLPPATEVSVTPEDYGAVPVSGKLLVLDHREVAIVRNDKRVGEVVVHFPRTGYRVEANT
jgi:glutathione S-transferase